MVRKEFENTRKYKLNDMDVDMDENKEEVEFHSQVR